MAKTQTQTINETETVKFPDFTKVQADFGKWFGDYTKTFANGKVSFVETEMARDDARHFYSYNLVTSPLPTTNYLGTIRVVANGPNASMDLSLPNICGSISSTSMKKNVK